MNVSIETKARQVRQLLNKIEAEIYNGRKPPQNKIERSKQILNTLCILNEKNDICGKDRIDGKKMFNLIERFRKCNDLNDKYAKIHNIEQDIIELTELFRDLHNLVITAEPVIHEITENVESALESAEKVEQELESAVSYNRVSTLAKVGIVVAGIALGPTAIALGYGAKTIAIGGCGLIITLYSMAK